MKTLLQYYMGGIKSNTPAGTISVGTLIEKIVNPRPETIKLIDSITKAGNGGKKELKTKLKEQLPFVVASVIVDTYRRYENIVSFTGLAQIDFDKVLDAIELKYYLFENYPQIVVAFLSPSKMGVKALIRIPVVSTVTEFQDYYRAIISEFSNIEGFDSAPKNAVLPLFLSYDVFALSRNNAEIWDIKEEVEPAEHRVNPIPPKNYFDNYNKNSDWKREKTIRIFEAKIRNINSSTGGHPNVRSASLVLGTRVGYGYLPYFEAVSLIEREINFNSYLSKDIKGYTKTALWGLEQGIKTPRSY